MKKRTSRWTLSSGEHGRRRAVLRHSVNRRVRIRAIPVTTGLALVLASAGPAVVAGAQTRNQGRMVPSQQKSLVPSPSKRAVSHRTSLVLQSLVHRGHARHSGRAATVKHAILAARSSTPDAPGRPATVFKVTVSFASPTQPAVSSATSTATPTDPSPPFHQCPAIGADTSCGDLIDVTNSGEIVFSDPTQGPFDGIEDTLIGVQNDSSGTVTSLQLSSNTNIFAFDGDGICSGAYGAWNGSAGCPYGPTGYEGPGTSFSNINAATSGGNVNFSPGIAPGGSAYFSLEEAVTNGSVFSGGPSTGEQGGPPNPSENPTTCSSGAPVNCGTGTLFHTLTDASIPGLGVPLIFTRTYSAAAAAADGPFGFGWTDSYNMGLSFDVAGDATVAQEDGSTVTFDRVGSAYVAPPRVLATFVANGDGTYTLTRYRTNVQYVFNSNGQLIREVDRNGYTTTLTYKGGGELTTITDQAGRTLTLTYSGGHIATLTDPMGHTTTFAYDNNGNLVRTTDPMGRTWRFTYDAHHLLLSMTDPRGGKTTNTYDTSARVTEQVDPLGRATTWSYSGNPSSPSGGTTTMTNPLGVKTSYVFSNLELTSVTRGLSTTAPATTTYAYDPATLGITTTTDPNGNTTTDTYDGHGNLLTRTDPLGNTTTYAYNSLDEPTSTTDPLGTTTTYTYDNAGNLLSEATPVTGGGTATTTYTYGTGARAADVLSETDPDGHTWTFTYDTAGDRTGVTDPLGHTTSYGFDILGRQTSVTTPLGHTTHSAYDAVGQLIKTTDPLGNVTTYKYDGDGNQIALTDPRGNTTTYAYDADNESVAVRRADGTTSQTTYYPDGTVKDQIDGTGHRIHYTYDPLGHEITLTDPLGRTTTYGYDKDGNRTTVTDPQGRVTTNTYDADNQLTSIAYSDGTTPNVTDITYDADGQRTGQKDGSGTWTWVWDSVHRLTSVTEGNSGTVSYHYNLRNEVTAITYPGAQAITRGYDADGHWTSVTDWLGQTTTFAYDADGNLTSENLPASTGVTDTWTYGPDDNLASIRDTRGGNPFFAAAYSRNTDQQLTGDSSMPEGSDSYGYTRVNRLCYAASTTTRCGSPSDEATAYRYDGTGNLVQNGKTKQTFDAADELTSASRGDAIGDSRYRKDKHERSATVFRYDPEGDRTEARTGDDRAVSYRYDQALRLAGIGKYISYTYNGEGVRMSKTIGSKHLASAWDLAGALPTLVSDGVNLYVYGPGGLPVEQIRGTQTLWFHHDGVGSTRVLTDASGRAVARYTYMPYGTIGSVSGDESTSLLFEGQYLDGESGLYYLRARYYDSVTAQFTSVDPAFVLTGSRYAYVFGDPLNAEDPTGLDCSLIPNPFDPNSCIRKGAGAVAGAAGDVGNGAKTLWNNSVGQVVHTVQNGGLPNGHCLILIQNNCEEDWSNNVATVSGAPIGIVLKTDPALSAIFDYTKWQNGGTVTPVDVIGDIVGFVPLDQVEDAYLRSVLDSAGAEEAAREYTFIKGYAGQFLEGLTGEGLGDFLNSVLYPEPSCG